MAVLIDPHGDSAGDRDSGDSAGCQRPDGMLALQGQGKDESFEVNEEADLRSASP